jgi:hypothetical protein
MSFKLSSSDCGTWCYHCFHPLSGRQKLIKLLIALLCVFSQGHFQRPNNASSHKIDLLRVAGRLPLRYWKDLEIILAQREPVCCEPPHFHFPSHQPSHPTSGTQHAEVPSWRSGSIPGGEQLSVEWCAASGRSSVSLIVMPSKSQEQSSLWAWVNQTLHFGRNICCPYSMV